MSDCRCSENFKCVHGCGECTYHDMCVQCINVFKTIRFIVQLWHHSPDRFFHILDSLQDNSRFCAIMMSLSDIIEAMRSPENETLKAAIMQACVWILRTFPCNLTTQVTLDKIVGKYPTLEADSFRHLLDTFRNDTPFIRLLLSAVGVSLRCSIN